MGRTCGSSSCDQRNYDPADIPGNNTSPAGPNGDHACDVPVDLEESMYAAIKDMFPDAAFSIFTGDLVEHAIWNTTQPTNIQRSKLKTFTNFTLYSNCCT